MAAGPSQVSSLAITVVVGGRATTVIANELT